MNLHRITPRTRCLWYKFLYMGLIDPVQKPHILPRRQLYPRPYRQDIGGGPATWIAFNHGTFNPPIRKIMDELGYECFQKTEAFAQFDSEMGILGKVDLLMVSSQDGRAILDRKVVVEDDLLGNQPVIQPTDYVILKLMAIANNPERATSDEADISVLLKLHSKHMISEIFEPLDTERLNFFAARFGQEDIIKKHLIQKISK